MDDFNGSNNQAPYGNGDDGAFQSPQYQQPQQNPQSYGQPAGGQFDSSYWQQGQQRRQQYGQQPAGQQYGQTYGQQYGQPYGYQSPYGQQQAPNGQPQYAQYQQSAQSGYDQQAYRQMPHYQAPPQPVYGPQQKSKLAAGLLGIFLGSLGVHNFYLGFTGKAVAQLLLTLVGWILLGLGPVVAGIWGLVEGILILCSTYGTDWHRDAKGIELSD